MPFYFAAGRREATSPLRFKKGLRLLNLIGLSLGHAEIDPKTFWCVLVAPVGAPGALLLLRQYGIKRAHFKQ